MNKRPGLVTVTTETGYCPFCRRTRNLRREQRQLGALVRTNIDCESCHRTLSSTMAMAAAEPVAAPVEPVAEPAAETVAPEAPSDTSPIEAVKARKPATGPRAPRKT